MFLYRRKDEDTMKPMQKAGILLFAGGVQFAILLIIAETQYPGYSVANNYISDLGLWKYRSAYIFNPSVFMFGLLALAAVVKAYQQMPRLTRELLIVAGIGAMGVAIFNETVLIPHGISAVMAFIGGGFAAISLAKHLKEPFNYIAVFMGSWTILSMALMAAGIQLGLGVGGIERMVMYPELLLVIGLGGYMAAGGME